MTSGAAETSTFSVRAASSIWKWITGALPETTVICCSRGLNPVAVTFKV